MPERIREIQTPSHGELLQNIQRGFVKGDVFAGEGHAISITVRECAPYAHSMPTEWPLKAHPMGEINPR